MARRNARRRPKQQAQSRTRKPLPGWLWFVTGLSCSLLGVFLYHLTTLPPQTTTANGPATATTEPEQASSPGITFNFYERLRQHTVKVPPPPAVNAPPTAPVRPPANKPPSSGDRPDQQTKDQRRYYLQAGSFKQRDQAEKRRIELLLLNTEASITRVQRDGMAWYRVHTGPYDSHQQADHIQHKLLNEGIDTLLTRR